MKTILIVDDEFGLVEIMTSLLEDVGYRVVSAANGIDGIAVLEQERPDLVLVDFMMPIANGRTLIVRMRANPDCRSVPVVMMSAVSKETALSAGPEGGTIEVAAFLAKPFDVRTLLDTVERLVGKP